MRICFIFFGFHSLKSILTPLYEYSRILSQMGFNVTLYVRDSKDIIRGGDNLTVNAVCKEYFSSKITRIVFLLKLISILRKEKFDIIHVFNFSTFLPMFCKKPREKWVLDIQSGRVEGGLESLFHNKLITFDARFFDKVVTLSKALRDKLFDNKFSKDIPIIPLGADIKKFAEAKKDRTIWQKYGLPEKSIILCYIGALDKTRKMENMLRAFQIAAKQQAENAMKLVIIGGANNDIERLKKEAYDLSIYDRVLFLGKVSYKEIPSYLVSSDIGLAYIPKTEIYDVQPPLKILEYLAASLPVVATDTRGNAEFIKDGHNGILCPGDPQSFGAAIDKLIRDKNLRERIKENARNSVLAHDWENIVAKYLLPIYSEKNENPAN